MNSIPDFVRLWTSHQEEVRRYVFLMVPRSRDAAEVLQEVSVRLWEKWPEYDASRPFVPWAIRFAYLEVLKWRQRQAREKLIFSDALLAQLDATQEEESPLMEARRGALQGCLQKLGPSERRWLGLRYANHGAIKAEATHSGGNLRKVYYALEKVRAALLRCVEGNLKQEGWLDA
ncbi:MAG: polymerase sigma factor CnrH [Verrucomicrobiota bacterium]|jgi:RNA polymerase sigma-70 factor (ECF subfamily)